VGQILKIGPGVVDTGLLEQVVSVPQVTGYPSGTHFIVRRETRWCGGEQ
jgi:hypothetical protein